MKKLLLLIGLAFTATLSCKAQHNLIGFTPSGDSIVSIPVKTVMPPPVIITPPADFNTLTAAENVFDNVWGVYGLSVGSEVNKLVTRKGAIDIVYTGRTKVNPSWANWAPLTMDGKLPIMVNPYYMRNKNIPSTQYTSPSFAKINAPYERWTVMRILPSATYEAYFGQGDFLYLANNGNQLRVTNPGGFLPNSTAPALYQTHIIRQIFDGKNSIVYVDNVLQGSYAVTAADIASNGLTMFGIDVTTNNADWDFAAMYFKAGNVSDPNGTYKALATKWGVGSYANEILLTNISVTKSGSTYTPTATIFYTPTGVKAADPAKFDYQWYYYYQHASTPDVPSPGFLDYQVPFSTKYQVTAADLPAGIAGISGLQLKIVIRPKDTNGNIGTWMESVGYPF
jgi:hypothetical protein